MTGGTGNLMIRQQGGVSVVNFLGSKVLDQTNINEIGRQLMTMVEESHRTRLLINFEKVEYLSSAVLGKLIKLQKLVNERKGRLVLCGIRPSIYEVFKITNLDRVFIICEDEADGLAKFGPAA